MTIDSNDKMVDVVSYDVVIGGDRTILVIERVRVNKSSRYQANCIASMNLSIDGNPTTMLYQITMTNQLMCIIHKCNFILKKLARLLLIRLWRI